MHEYAITESILEIVQAEAAKADAQHVQEITVVVGELSTFVDHSIEFYFEELSRGTVAEGARLIFLKQEASASCCTCEASFHPNSAFFACPKCGSRLFDLKQGQELYIDNIEVE